MIEITIPVLDEEETINDKIREVLSHVESQLSDLAPIKLVIADNGSGDRTPEISGALVAEFPDRVAYLRLEERGVGRALKASWGRSDAEIVGYMDLDLATDLKHLHRALELLRSGEADIVTGSRLTKGSKVIGRSLIRATTSRVFNALVQSMFNIGFTDGMCGFKFLRRSNLAKIRDIGAVSDGWIFATEVLIVGEFLGLKVVDLPVRWTDDPNSKVKIAKLAHDYMKALRVLRKKLHSGPV